MRLAVEWLKEEGLSFTAVQKAHGKGVTGQDLGDIYWGGISYDAVCGNSR